MGSPAGTHVAQVIADKVSAPRAGLVKVCEHGGTARELTYVCHLRPDPAIACTVSLHDLPLLQRWRH